MTIIDNPAELAEDLCHRGIDACHEIVYAPGGYQEGLDIGDDFFPLWELALPENQHALALLDFAAIKARRGPEWSIAAPHAEIDAELVD
jgi:hypothetical protein